MTCANPAAMEVLADYWLAALPAAEEAALEEHLLECDVCGDRLRDVIAMAESLRRLAHEGSLRVVVSDDFVRRARENGRQVREYPVALNGSVACTVTEDDDLLVARLTMEVNAASRVDVSMCDAQGVELRRLRDIPIRAGADTLLFQESMTFAKAAPSMTTVVRLMSVDDTEGEQLLGEYTFNHTRSLPGPGRLPPA